jgi:TM2 domain-containing membrane protein YozV
VVVADDPTDKDELRIGTQEREDAIRILGDHMAEGRLEVDEYEERVAKVAEAKTNGEIRPLFKDLPAPYPAFVVPPVQALPPMPPPMVPPRAVPVYPQYAPVPVVPSDRNRYVAGVLQIVLPFGIGRFYTGHTGMALAQLFTCFIFVGFIWSFVDGIVLLANGGTDAHGRPLTS